MGKDQTVTMNDATSKAIETLGVQLGSDARTLAELMIDVRRLTNISTADRTMIAYFSLLDEKEGGEFARDFFDQYMNLSMSVNGERAKMIVQALANIAGSEKSPKAKHKRSIFDRLTGRNKDPEDDQ